MPNLSKYRKLSVTAMIVMAVSWLFGLGALWNSILTTEAKHEGWIIVFMLLVLIIGLLLFYISYITTDIAASEKMRKEAFESGKAEIIQEIERKSKEESTQKAGMDDLQAAVDAILSGLQGARAQHGLCNKVLGNLAREMGFVQGIIYVKNKNEEMFNPSGEYALTDRKPQPFKAGETLPGQVAESKSLMVINDIPENYFVVSSGLGSSQPRCLILSPVLLNNETIAVLELASFKKPDERTHEILNKVSSELGPKLKKFISA
jgi:hypothetical protein